jgi:hypothetical protein
MRFLNNLSFNTKRSLFFLTGLTLTILICWLTSIFGMIVWLAIIGLASLILIQVTNFTNPKFTLYLLIAYCFTMPIFAREIGGFQYGILVEILIAFAYIAAVVKVPVEEWKLVKTDLYYVLLFWFLLSVAEVINPAGASVMGWLQEIRSAALYPLILIPVTYVLFKTNKDLNGFLKIIIIISAFASLNGIKQLYIGLSPGEQAFIDNGGAVTHVLFGKLRVFSFYNEAGQFGASQAHIAVVSLVLAFGPFKWWKRVLLFIAAGLSLYGMLISGTRGALFALLAGLFLAILLSKNFKVMIIGGAIVVFAVALLKFTTIGNGNYQIYRLRSAVDPTDPSLNVRFNTQRILTEYMSTRPFGGGLGVLGAWGEKYNQDKFLSSIPPDSYWVKVWAMYGIVGFVIWIGLMMYILGKCCGIIWRLQDPGLKVKAIALTAGFAGILLCSYGNEVINSMPSSIIVYISWVFVFISPRLQDEIANKKVQNIK